MWIGGRSGAGKSFTGDYLNVVCDFVHIDGDCCFHSDDPIQKDLTANLIKCYYSYWFDEMVIIVYIYKCVYIIYI